MQQEKFVEALAEVAVRVTSETWDKTIAYYRDIIGLLIVEETSDRVLFRAKRDAFHHTFTVLRSDRLGLERAVWKVFEPDDLDKVAELAQGFGLEVNELDSEEIPGIARGIQFIDPGGHRMVFTDRVLMVPPRPEPWRGVSVHFLDHFNVNYETELSRAVQLYVEILGFSITDTASVGGNRIGYWLRASHLHHDMAIMAGGNFFHHVAFRCVSPDDLRRAADQFADLRYPIDHGPAAHAPIGMYFLYVKDPAGNRNELFVDEVRSWTAWETGPYADDDVSGDYPLERLLARFGPVPQPEFYVTGT